MPSPRSLPLRGIIPELALGNIILLVRNLPDKIIKMHQGIWHKSAVNSHEIRGKKLGIVGYGNIGQQLSVLAEAIGMEVYYYDLADRPALESIGGRSNGYFRS